MVSMSAPELRWCHGEYLGEIGLLTESSLPIKFRVKFLAPPPLLSFLRCLHQWIWRRFPVLWRLSMWETTLIFQGSCSCGEFSSEQKLLIFRFATDCMWNVMTVKPGLSTLANKPGFSNTVVPNIGQPRCSWTENPRNPSQHRWWWRLWGTAVQEHLGCPRLGTTSLTT